mmetsp:Transcript_18967/g.54058  ORF Transcript_18967/g.54058 Transcript_18967/m.54058 type:complete len:221 (-) Transcript_18967:444-1106(-)
MPISSASSASSNRILNSSCTRSICSAASGNDLHTRIPRLTFNFSASGNLWKPSITRSIAFFNCSGDMFSCAFDTSSRNLNSMFGCSGIRTSSMASKGSGVCGMWYVARRCSASSGSALHLSKMSSRISRIFGTGSFASAILRTTRWTVPTNHLHLASNSAGPGASSFLESRAPCRRSESGRLFWACSAILFISSKMARVLSSRSWRPIFSSTLLHWSIAT